MLFQYQEESPRTEIEIATVVFGVLLVMVSILTTMPNDTLDILKRMVLWFQSDTGTTTTPAANTISILILYSLLFLLITIPLYLLHLSLKKPFVLLCARTFLVLGVALAIPVLIMFNGLFMFRLIGRDATLALINPTLALITTLGYAIGGLWMFVLWYRNQMYWLPFLKRLFSKHGLKKIYKLFTS